MRHFDEITVSNGEIRKMDEDENNKKVGKKLIKMKAI